MHNSIKINNQMKKTIFTLLLIATAIFGLNAQTFFVVHGTVNNLNGQPVNGHQVFIASDSLNNPTGGNYFAVVYTNPNGYFMDTVPFIGGTNMAFRVYTFDCNQAIHDTLVYSGLPQGLIEFNICEQVTPGCQAAFQAFTDSSGTHFTDYSVGNISNWVWDFFDPTTGTNNSSSLQNPTHTYMSPGIYMVCLTVWSGDSLCTSTWCDNITVGNNPGCQATFQAYANPGTTLFQFNDFSVGNISNWRWDFGDPASGISNTSTLQNPQHAYLLPGTYNVCLTISSDDSIACTSTWCKNIIVGNSPGCQAAFQVYPDSSGTLSYQFHDYSVGNISGWYWNFGDNTASYIQNPQHIYAGPGVYNVCLHIWSNDTLGCNSMWCDTIMVGNIPNCSNYFSYTTTQMSTSFAGTAIGYSNPTFSWNFGDGSTGTGQYITHIYSEYSYYVATLTTSDTSGCTYISSQMVYIDQPGDHIWGKVSAGNTYADQARVLLYINNSGSNIFTLIDSTLIDSSGFYQFTGINSNVVFLKAELLPVSTYYGHYMPTYFDSTMYWNEATGIVVWQPNNQYNIGLIPANGITNTGNGTINGTITYGNGKGMAAPGVEVILLDANGNPLAYTYTDNTGWYSFADLSYGTYLVYVEIPGMTTDPATSTLNEANPVSTMAFVIVENSVALSVEDQLPAGFKAIGQVFPNPVNGDAAIIINLERSSTFELRIINITGNIIKTEVLSMPAGQQKVMLNTTQLPSGVYGLLITTPGGGRTMRKFVVVK
jgi:PKD repeat protein